MNHIGKRIAQLRKEKNLTQEQLAEALYVTRQAVSSWENGKNQPDIETLTTLAEYFGVTIEELIYGEQRSIREKVVEKVVPSSSSAGKAGIGFGAALAIVISYTHWQSVGWAIIPGILGWGYVIYHLIRY